MLLGREGTVKFSGFVWLVNFVKSLLSKTFQKIFAYFCKVDFLIKIAQRINK